MKILTVPAEVMARLERRYGRASFVTPPWAAVVGLCIGAPQDATLVDCGDSRIVVIDAAGHETLYDLKAIIR